MLKVASAEARQRIGYLASAARNGHRRHWSEIRRNAFRIVCIGGRAEPNSGDVLLVGAGEEDGEPGRASDDERQHASRKRIERTGVPDAFDAESASDDGDDVVRGWSGGLIYDENAVNV
jgi:hypothetical protein